MNLYLVRLAEDADRAQGVWPECSEYFPTRRKAFAFLSTLLDPDGYFRLKKDDVVVERHRVRKLSPKRLAVALLERVGYLKKAKVVFPRWRHGAYGA